MYTTVAQMNSDSERDSMAIAPPPPDGTNTTFGKIEHGHDDENDDDFDGDDDDGNDMNRESPTHRHNNKRRNGRNHSYRTLMNTAWDRATTTHRHAEMRVWKILCGILLLAWIITLMYVFIHVPSQHYNIPPYNNNNNNNNNIPKSSSSSSITITYDPSVSQREWNPFHINETAEHYDSSMIVPPTLPDDNHSNNNNNNNNNNRNIYGYMTQPNIVQNQLVFVSEGDLYWTTMPSSSSNTRKMMTAIRLTVTVGNVQHPKINPVFPHFIAYTATYQARRDVYLLDLRGGSSSSGSSTTVPAAQRLTYVDSPVGVETLVGWSQNGTVLTYGTTSMQVGLRDLRLYDLAIATSTTTATTGQPAMSILETRPVPLSQATDAVRVSKSSSLNDDDDDDDYDDGNEDCMIFVRYKQHSHTARYVGGTTEQLWLYCHNETQAIPLTSDYSGTSKQPAIYYDTSQQPPQRYLLFMSDRTLMTDPIGPKVFQSPNQQWRATTMNLWAVAMPHRILDWYETYRRETSTPPTTTTTTTPPHVVTIIPPTTMIQLTHISCQFHGLSLQEYTVDTNSRGRSSTGVILRIGADLYHVSSDQINTQLMKRRHDSSSGDSNDIGHHPVLLPIQVMSDFHEQQERMISMKFPESYGRRDVFTTHYESTSLLMTLRGQVWVAPVLEISTRDIVPYEGSTGLNTPPRRYRVIPGSMTGGAIRVLAALHVPLYTAAATSNSTNTINATDNPNRRLALVLATDPMSPTAEHAFYMVEIQSDLLNQFNDLNHWPVPFVGGNVNGGSINDGGLGTVLHETLVVSSCGRRFAWTDTDNRICVMTMPIYQNVRTFQCLPPKNDQGEPLSGTVSSLTWSPGGRYLGIEHNALNQFTVISIADCGSPESEKGDAVVEIVLGPIVQVTPSRFNSFAFSWGKSSFDTFWSSFVTALGYPPPKDVSTTLYFVSDRDVISDVKNPWGTRAPSPHFPRHDGHMYALPLLAKRTTNTNESFSTRYPGGGTAELFFDDIIAYANDMQTTTGEDHPNRRLRETIINNLSRGMKGRQLRGNEKVTVARYLQEQLESNGNVTESMPASPFPQDADLDLPPASSDLSLARTAYRIPRIPKGKYVMTSQTLDDGSFILLEHQEIEDYRIRYFSANPFPSDVLDGYTVSDVDNCVESTSGQHLVFVATTGETTVIPKTSAGLSSFISDLDWVRHRANVEEMAISVWPSLEYRQMYNDAWRLMRDYFYDSNMHNVNWSEVLTKYLPLVQRCGKREELDDVLGQMASETSALHSFVYGGEYSTPDSPPLQPASLGAFFKRTPEWNGYRVEEIPHRDPDFDLIDGDAVYCPISDAALRPTGQRGLAVGDVIVAVNGESVMSVPDIHMMLRGTAGRSIRLEVLRLSSSPNHHSPGTTVANTESLVVVPLSTYSADSLRYNAWEWSTRQQAKELALQSGFTVAYVHMRAMDRDGEDAFARGFYPDYDKDALLLDVRHNQGGNIDSWILAALQRQAFMYWAPRSGDHRNGEMDWDEQFAFRGKVVVLVDELTASNGEGVARGLSELGIGKVIGTRTWGGGIWGSSSNKLVDGGLAAAPQWGIYNAKFGWGGGVEMTGVEPDVIVDNDPFQSFQRRDVQLERAIAELSTWLKHDPIPVVQVPVGGRPDMSLHDDCPA